MSGWHPFTKSNPAAPMPTAGKAKPSSTDQYGIKRLLKSEAKTPQGMMRPADKIIENQPTEIESPTMEAMSYAEQRCRSIDPNAYRTRAPFNRVRNPREAPKRRPAGWTDCRIVLPKLILEGLRTLTIELANQQQNSDWPGERCRYPRTKNFHLTAALNDYFAKLGYHQFCVQEQPIEGRRRFIAPTT